jgi:hypothetical protein
VGAAVVPAPSSAAVSYPPPYAAGPQGGDQFNVISADAATGDMTVLRVNPAGVSGGLGCGGSGGFANFEVVHTDETTPVKSVTVAYDNAIIDAYSWINVGVRKGSSYVGSRVERGILTGTGTVTVTLGAPVQAPVTIWFGIQVASACPNVNGGHAHFASVLVADA